MNGGAAMLQNIFRIYDGRTSFYQWDTEQQLIVLDSAIMRRATESEEVIQSRYEKVY